MRLKISIKPDKQCGAALVVSLIILLVMTLIGVTSMQTTVMQEKMAGNARDLNTAFQAGEAAARAGETWLTGLTAVPDPTICTPILGQCALWNAYGGATGLWNATGFNSYTVNGLWANARLATVPGSNAAIPTTGANPPQYFVEFIDILRDSQNLGQQQDLDGSSFRNVYAVTARGTGGTATASAFVQTNFARRF